MHHVIVGAGPAGVIAAETLRGLQADSRISLVGDEPEPPYSRMALPYFLSGHIPENGTHLRKHPEHFSRLGIELVQDRVTGIERSTRSLHLDGGTSLQYDSLLLATGSRPVVPPIPGITLPGVFACWTLRDGRNIAARAKPGAKIVLLGAGFIGCIILEALARSGADLTVIEMADRMVPRMMNEVAGGLIKTWCERRGIRVLTGTTVTGIEKSADDRLTVTLSTGAMLPADLLVAATGVQPNIEFIAGTGIEIDRGILINRNMQTNDPRIFAAGDVAQGRDFSTGEYAIQAIQPTAAEHGQLAGRNLAGRLGAVHRGSLNMNVLDTVGLISSSFGLWMGSGTGDCAELLNRERFRYLNLQFQDDLLVGATSIGLTEHVGVLRGLIQSKIRLGKWKGRLMEDPTRIMEAYLGSTQAVGFNAGVF